MNVLHAAELAAWIGGAVASGIATYKAPKWSGAWWAGIAGILCNVALIANHL